jgi:hypothetical protein
MGKSHRVEAVMLARSVKKPVPFGPSPAFDSTAYLRRGRESLNDAGNLPVAAESFN